TSFAFTLPSSSAAGGDGSVTANMSALAYRDEQNRRAYNGIVVRSAMQTAGVAMQYGVQAAVPIAVVGLAIAGVGKLLDHLVGPKLEDLKRDLRAKCDEAIDTLALHLLEESPATINRLEVASNAVVANKVA